MDKHRYNAPWDKHMRRGHRDGFPGLNLRGLTLREIRRRMRGGDGPADGRDDFKEGEADGTAAR